MSIEPARRPELEVFAEEIRVAVRYERGLVVKAVAVLVLLALLVVLRLLYFS
jgi:hypothetical protein